MLVEQPRALGLGVGAKQRQRAADGNFLRRLGKLLHPLGLPAAFCERGLILLRSWRRRCMTARRAPQCRQAPAGPEAIFSARPARFRPIQGMANISSTVSPGMTKIEISLRPSAERFVKLVEAAERPLGPCRAGIVDGIGRGAQFDAGLRTGNAVARRQPHDDRQHDAAGRRVAPGLSRPIGNGPLPSPPAPLPDGEGRPLASKPWRAKPGGRGATSNQQSRRAGPDVQGQEARDRKRAELRAADRQLAQPGTDPGRCER